MLDIGLHGRVSHLDEQRLSAFAFGFCSVVRARGRRKKVVHQRLEERRVFVRLQAAAPERPADERRQKLLKHLDAQAQLIDLVHGTTFRGGVSNPTIAAGRVLSSILPKAASLLSPDDADLLAHHRRLSTAQPAEVAA